MHTYLFLFICPILIAQEKNFELSLFPSGLHFIQLIANMQEAKIGVLYYPDNSNLKVDIGNNIDLIKLQWIKNKSQLTFGIEFMAYALSTNYNGNRLQIDAVDGFFGGNASFSKKFENNILQLRFRIIHNSAHFVDGHYDFNTNNWKNNVKPIPFTRDFGEVTISNIVNKYHFSIRYYGSIGYSVLVRPEQIKKYFFNSGIELNSNKLLDKFLEQEINLFIAYNFYLHGVPKYVDDNNILIGIKLGDWYSKGIIIYVSYFSGKNYFNEYYSEKFKKIGIGFFVVYL